MGAQPTELWKPKVIRYAQNLNLHRHIKQKHNLIASIDEKYSKHYANVHTTGMDNQGYKHLEFS